MQAITLLYHDAIEAGEPDASGFPGVGPAVYKLAAEEMGAHFDALAAAGFRPGGVMSWLNADGAGQSPPGFITFDDGGVSAILPIADMLEEHGWVGHFFVPTESIGRPAFLSADQLRALDSRGHVIGSHSHTHPPRISALSREAIRDEWATSVSILAQILGHEIRVASVPGGFYSRTVAETAAEAGIVVLFTSEPVKRYGFVGNCRVLGRFTITRGVPPRRAVALSAAGRSSSQLHQYLSWNLKKGLKAAGGKHYLRARRVLLGG